jgi:aspartate/methionine/tyrosine aminotransferase
VLNLTETELLALPEIHNLCDGHARRSWSSAEAAIVQQAHLIMGRADRRHQAAFESDYVDCFFGLAKQTRPSDPDAVTFYFSASQALEAVANYLRLCGKSVALIEPCFDSLGDIIRRHGIAMEAIPESVLADAESAEYALSGLTADAVFLVSPNNPTGLTINQATLAAIAAHCAARRRLLILDSCFRFYTPEDEVYDQYQTLLESDVDYVVLEDTGKTWPTLELKAPFLAASPAIAGPLARIRSDFLLHVSPFTIQLVREFVQLSVDDGLGYVRGVVARNRETLARHIASTCLAAANTGDVSLAWLEVRDGRAARPVTEALAARGVHVLPGERFFWSNPASGRNHLRIALVRDAEPFEAACEVIEEVCK